MFLLKLQDTTSITTVVIQYTFILIIFGLKFIESFQFNEPYVFTCGAFVSSAAFTALYCSLSVWNQGKKTF